MSPWHRFLLWWNNRWLDWRMAHAGARRGRTSHIQRDRYGAIAGWIDPKQRGSGLEATSGTTQAVEVPHRVTMSLRVYRAATDTWEDEIVVADERVKVPPELLAALEAAAKQE